VEGIVTLVIVDICHNPSLGFTTNAKGACKVAGQEEAHESYHMFPGV
jgi:hypothetical protein